MRQTAILLLAAAAAIAAAPAGARPNIGTVTTHACGGPICFTTFNTVDGNDYQRKLRFTYRGHRDVQFYRIRYVDKYTGLTTKVVTVIHDSSRFESRNWSINVDPSQRYNFSVQACTAHGDCTSWRNFYLKTRSA
jgi:hypothetical protein